MTPPREPMLPESRPASAASGLEPLLSGTVSGKPWFVVPSKGVATLVAGHAGGMTPIAPLPDAPPDAEWAADPTTGWVAWIADSWSLGLARLTDQLRPQRPPALPTRFRPYGLAMSRGVLYVAGFVGHDSGHNLGFFDLGRDPSVWQPVILPPARKHLHGSFKAVQVVGDKLFALDPVLTRVTMGCFDIANPVAPVLEQAAEVGIHCGSDVFAESIAATEHAVAVLLKLDGGPRRSDLWEWIVQVHPRSNLDRHWVFDVSEIGRPQGRRELLHPNRQPHRHRDISTLGEDLLIAGGERGIGVLNLRAASAFADFAGDSRAVPPLEALENYGFRFQALDGPLAGRPVVRVYGVPRTRTVLAVAWAEGDSDTVAQAIPSSSAPI